MNRKDRELRGKLLAQNGICDGSLSEADRESLRRILAREQRRLRAMKRGRMVLWLAVVVWPVLAALSARVLEKCADLTLRGVVGIAVMVWYVIVLLAVLATIRVFLFSRTVGMHQIQTALGRIIEQLERLSDKA